MIYSQTGHIYSPRFKDKAAPTDRLLIHILVTILLLTLFGTSTAFAQDYSGVYYIGSNGYNANNTQSNYYLCPTDRWYYYQSEFPYYTDTDNGLPFLTTYTCRDDSYSADNAVWIVQKKTDTNYYYIIHAIDGYYLTRNVAMGNNSNVGRMRVHLEPSPADDNDALFEITWIDSKGCFDIKTKKNDGDNNADNLKRRFLNVTNGNQNFLQANGKTDGPKINNKNIAVGGIIGLWTKGSDEGEPNGMWYFENATIDAPTITNNYTATNTFTITAASGATIYYTTDGTTPTTSTTTTGTTTVNITMTDDMTVIKAIAKGANDAFPTMVTTYEIPKCERPAITVRTGMVTITCNTTDANIHYTTNGDHATSSSPVYTAPFAREESMTVRAIATKTGYVNSFEVHILPPSEVSSSSEITDMNGHYILADDFTLSGSIGTAEDPFTGTIDGNMVTRSLSYPLVAYAEDATIKNIILKNITISGGANVGAICNEARGACRIYNCGILGTSTISGSGYVGSIVGLLDGTSRVINCYSFATVSGGTIAAGIVGNNNQTSTQNDLKTIVVNCMFYGNITGASSIYPVYGGNSINNDTDDGINPYCYYRKNATFTPTGYNRSWPAEEKNLTRFEYYRSVLNSNRKLCTWWVNGINGTAPTDDDIKDVGIAKWVLDPTIAPYPILKPWGKYPSIINPDAENRFDPNSGTWQSRSIANEWEGKSYSTLTVTVQPGSHNSSADNVTKYITITDMDTLNQDYGYYKIQLPYYNEVFGNPNGATHAQKYGNNYTDQVVTGWMITAITTDGTITEYNNFVANWESGYNFADRRCIDKDLYETTGRVFAQGGYYYIPEGVTGITITAKWGNAVYLVNRNYSIDRVKVTAGGYPNNQEDEAKNFAPAGTVPNTFQDQMVYNDLQDAITALREATVTNGVLSLSVYDQAIVLIGNHQVKNGDNSIAYNLDNKWHPFTIMSADFDFDNEPDYCLQFQFRTATQRPGIQPIRFDFLPVIELGLAVRHNNLAYAIGVFIPQGHFEITETAFMRTTQFEWDCGQEGGTQRTANNVPVILNGGEFDQLAIRYGNGNRTGYFLLGGHLWFHRFAPGTHPNNASTNKAKARLCAVNAIGGDFPEFYLSGLYRADITPRDDQGNPHCYIDGGNFGYVYGAGYEKINGSVTFKVNHARIVEFYGGGINGSNPVGGNIDVTIDNSIVSKYCGGPKVGNMTGKTITTHATGTTFDVFYGGGNGGNSYYRQMLKDGDEASNHIGTWTDKGYNWNDFKPLQVYDAGTDNKGYHAEYEFEVFNQSNGVMDQITQRGFIKWIQFGLTKTGDVSNTLTDCTIKTNFYGGGNLGTVDGDVTSTLTNTTVMGNAYGAGFSATIPTFQVQDKSTVHFPSIAAGVITDGSIGYDTRVFEWTNDLNGMTESERKAEPTYQKDGKWYCYTWNSLENLGVVTGNVTLNIEGNTLVMGSVTENNVTVQSGGIFGGGDASAVNGNTQVNIDASAQKSGYTYNTYNVFGGGNKADVGGSVTVSMEQGVVDNDIYGGGALAHTNINNSSNTTDNVTSVNLIGGVVKGDVYGGGLGRLAGDDIEAVAASVEGDVTVILNGTTLTGTSRIFGGNNINGTPLGQITVDIERTINTGQDYDVAAVFGGGNMAAYSPTVTTTPAIVIVKGCSNSIKDLFGGGNAAAVSATSVTIQGGTFDRVFAGGNGQESAADVNGNTNVLIKGGTIRQVFGGGNISGTIEGTINVEINKEDEGCDMLLTEVYGGGNKAASNAGNLTIVRTGGQDEGIENVFGGANDADVDGNIILNITGGRITNLFGGNNTGHTVKGDIQVNVNWNDANGENDAKYLGYVYGGGQKADVSGGVEVNIIKGIIAHDVYGGGALANTNTGNINNDETITTDRHVTEVNLHPNATIHGDVYGGGRGQKANEDEGIEPIEATVYGDISLYQLGAILVPQYSADSLATAGRIFGCNNANGSPMGHVYVYVSTTTKNSVSDKYAISAVYGGGNEASYIPYLKTQDNSESTEVVIDGCNNVTIHSVYGGGNAASTPATNVKILGAKEIKYVYGGGNGAGYIDGKPNPGANVGYKVYPDSVAAPSQIDERAEYIYGSGKAVTEVSGGTIQYVYGGSNTKGNVRNSTVAQLEELGNCPLVIGEIYGGGREAYMEGKANIELGCITGMEEIYGGSEKADVGGSVELTITSGTFNRVFGGNNKGGRIYGSITVNIEQTGCLPIIIGNLYLGGNNAPYSVYGYKDSTYVVNLNGDTITHYCLLESGNKYPDPQLNIRSFATIDTVFGGGNGSYATMVGDPTVDINITHGWINGEFTGQSDYAGSPQMLQDDGVIGTVFGGGNEAKVIGNTRILIGDKLNSPVTLRSIQKINDELDADQDHTITDHGITITQTENGVTYTNSTDSEKTLTVTNTQTVIGATITGNVYGGGNMADVTGSATIQLGPNP